ncbi:HAD family phosphatase [Priestia endophytica]|uniref:HAD family hydrolase n=1 Tax=Priestia endophytica TaxID=135735 RepID=UPI003D288BC8
MGKLAVIFDMDGVIIDSEPIYRSWNKDVFKKLKIQVDEETQLSFVGGTAKRKWTILKEKFSLSPSVEELICLQNEIFSQKEWAFKSLLSPAVLPLLQELKEHRIPTTLASSSNKKKISAVLDQCELRAYFDEVISGEDFEKGKPDPDIFLHVAEKLGVPTSTCVVIEDSYNGLTAAKRAGMHCIGVRHKEIHMNLSQADRIVASLGEIHIEELKSFLKGKG